MRIWGTLPGERIAVRGVARAAIAGAKREELMQEALHVVLSSGLADRAGVWMEAPNSAAAEEGLASFPGMVAERGREEASAEWARLSMEAPVLRELLKSGRSVEQNLER